MIADLTREQAREQVARIIAAQRYHYGSAVADRDADAALTVLWPVVEGLRAEREELAERIAGEYEAGFMAGFSESGEGFNGELDSDRGNTADADQAWLNHGGPDLNRPAVEPSHAKARAYAAEVLRNAGRAINPTQNEMRTHTFDRESYLSGQIGARYAAWDYLFSLAQLIEYGHENGEHIDALRFSVKDAQDEAIERLADEVERLRCELVETEADLAEARIGDCAEVERLRAELAHAHTVIARHVEPRREGEPCTGGVPIPTEVGVPAPELDGMHERAMEAGQRGVEKMWEEWRARACRPNLGDCCDGSAHTWQPSEGSRLPDRVDGNRPSDALCGDLTGEGCGPGVSGRDDRTEGA